MCIDGANGGAFAGALPYFVARPHVRVSCECKKVGRFLSVFTTGRHGAERNPVAGSFGGDHGDPERPNFMGRSESRGGPVARSVGRGSSALVGWLYIRQTTGRLPTGRRAAAVELPGDLPGVAEFRK